MLKPDTKKDICQVSQTGARGLTLLGLLIDAPRSLEEIREAFLQCGIMDSDSSDDILRIDLNTLRAVGCKISRADISTDYKYNLISHPYSLKITKEEVNLLKRVYSKIKNSLNIEELVQYEEFFKKLGAHVDDTEIKEMLYGLSSLKRYNIELINQLQQDCKYGRVIKLTYKTPVHKQSIEKEIIAQKIEYKNDKLYLYGFDIDKQESVTLNLKRIINILSRKDDNGSVINTGVKITFCLKNFNIQGLNENEIILGGNFAEGFIIEGKYHNKFVALQRILSFGKDCVVIEPDNFKEEIVQSLKNMRAVYD